MSVQRWTYDADVGLCRRLDNGNYEFLPHREEVVKYADHVAALAEAEQQFNETLNRLGKCNGCQEDLDYVRAEALREAREAVVAQRSVTPNLIRRDDALAAIDARQAPKALVNHCGVCSRPTIWVQQDSRPIWFHEDDNTVACSGEAPEPLTGAELAAEIAAHDNKGFSEERCLRCGWVMGSPALNCNNDDTPHRFPSHSPISHSGEAPEPLGEVTR